MGLKNKARIWIVLEKGKGVSDPVSDEPLLFSKSVLFLLL